MNDSLNSVDDASNGSLDARLANNRELRQRMHRLIDVIEAAAGDCVTAAQAEARVLEEIRRMGVEALTAWSQRAEAQAQQEVHTKYPDAVRDAKKKLYWYSVFGKIWLKEQCWRTSRHGSRVRPFCQRAQILARQCSLGVQRALVDFGVEHSFAAAAARFAEHYGWSIAPTVLRHWTLHHAGQSADAVIPPLPAPQETLISGVDGSMVPIICPAQSGDRRKNKTLLWREVRVAFARRKEDVSTRYGATLDHALGAGLMWRETAEKAGLHENTDVHALGDGACWIVEQCDRQFGQRATFLVDIQHVHDYVAAAAMGCAPGSSGQWLERQKQRLLENQVEQILAELKTHFEVAEKDKEGKTPPVRQAYQYIEERKNWMDYRGALEAGLPIGSGQVESAHRHIVQARVKKAGAWWREPNVQALVQMRVVRANDGWKTYWQHLASLN